MHEHGTGLLHGHIARRAARALNTRRHRITAAVGHPCCGGSPPAFKTQSLCIGMMSAGAPVGSVPPRPGFLSVDGLIAREQRPRLAHCDACLTQHIVVFEFIVFVKARDSTLVVRSTSEVGQSSDICLSEVRTPLPSARAIHLGRIYTHAHLTRLWLVWKLAARLQKSSSVRAGRVQQWATLSS